MNIFISCLQSPAAHSIPSYRFWREYFREGVLEASHTPIETPDGDWAVGLGLEGDEFNYWKAKIWSQTVDFLKDESKRSKVDLAIFYLFPQQIDHAALADIRKLGIPCVHFFCDNVREFTRVPNEFQGFDLYWVPEFEALPMYRRARLSIIHAPMPIWIPPESRRCDHEEKFGVTFVGSMDQQRSALFDEVLSRGIPIEIRGHGWIPTPVTDSPITHQLSSKSSKIINQIRFVRRYGFRAMFRKFSERNRQPVPVSRFAEVVRTRPRDTKEYTEITQQSQIVLGVNRYPSPRYPFRTPHTYSRLRDLEAPMMGACYLTEWAPGLESMYEIGNEIEIYRTVDELADKISLLQGSVALRRQLRQNGQSRALRDHSIPNTLSRISVNLGLR